MPARSAFYRGRRRLVNVDVDVDCRAELLFKRAVQLCDECPPFWREISLLAQPGRVDAELADNVHHMAITVHHDGQIVTGVTGAAPRVPWVTCPGAVAQLDLLTGSAVTGARVRIDQTQQCTHLLDLARLAIAQIQRQGARRYRAAIHHDEASRLVVARLARDGLPLLDWRLDKGVVQSPGPFARHDTQGRSIWSDAVAADPDLIEAGLVLRRVVYVFRSRRFSAPRRSAADTPGMAGVCYSFQPDRASRAVRPVDFAELP